MQLLTEQSKQLHTLQTEVGMMSFAERHGMSDLFRLLVFCSSANNERCVTGSVRSGINRWKKSDVLNAVVSAGILTRSQFYHALRMNKSLGSPLIEEYKVDGDTWLHVMGTKRFYRWVSTHYNHKITMIGIAYIPVQPDLHKKQVWGKQVYSAFLQQMQGQPITRKTIATITGINEDTQRSYDKQLGITVSKRYVIDDALNVKQVGNAYSIPETNPVTVTVLRGWQVWVDNRLKSAPELTGKELFGLFFADLGRDDCFPFSSRKDGIGVPLAPLYDYTHTKREYMRFKPYGGTLRKHRTAKNHYWYPQLKDGLFQELLDNLGFYIQAKNPLLQPILESIRSI